MSVSSLEDLNTDENPFPDNINDANLTPEEIGRKYKDTLGKAKCILVDISGTLYNSDADPTVSPGAVAAFEKLRSSGLEVRVISNSLRITTQGYHDILTKLGFNIPFEHVITSADLTRKHLEKSGLHPYMLTAPELKSHFEDLTDEDGNNANCVLVGLPCTQFDYCLLGQAISLLLNKKAPLISYNTADHEHIYEKLPISILGPGPFVQALEFIMGTESLRICKPFRPFFESLLKYIGFTAEECILIGDDICEDIHGASSVNMNCILVHTGFYHPDDKLSDVPTAAVDNFTTAVQYILWARSVVSTGTYKEPVMEKPIVESSEGIKKREKRDCMQELFPEMNVDVCQPGTIREIPLDPDGKC